jgi:predicted anti-sigma-YlaC factor YlaD
MATHHTTDDDPGLHALDRLPKPDTAQVEEHLLVCEECRQRSALR